ncbi:hypothetical protein K2173_017681 [Erythroxylum novogranatense]|uniref:Uncharacterized protein n=1 Tax=Erythroxylum novogranatense TaxID=1862640 RepID=A0AAV8SM52_9ROSI|nr:hypothetical protein K2173_017681 [Erythroxylum novogranatense]
MNKNLMNTINRTEDLSPLDWFRTKAVRFIPFVTFGGLRRFLVAFSPSVFGDIRVN